MNHRSIALVVSDVCDLEARIAGVPRGFDLQHAGLAGSIARLDSAVATTTSGTPFDQCRDDEDL